MRFELRRWSRIIGFDSTFEMTDATFGRRDLDELSFSRPLTCLALGGLSFSTPFCLHADASSAHGLGGVLTMTGVLSMTSTVSTLMAVSLEAVGLLVASGENTVTLEADEELQAADGEQAFEHEGCEEAAGTGGNRRSANIVNSSLTVC